MLAFLQGPCESLNELQGFVSQWTPVSNDPHVRIECSLAKREC